MSEAAHIFLSYRNIEAEFALKLAADLKNAGVRLWMDRLDGIQVGMDWRDAIQGAINACAALIAVLSPEYTQAKYCKKELAHADALNLPIFPVLLYPVEKPAWPLALAGMQYEDFTDWRDEKKYAQHFDKLLARLKKDMAEQVGAVPDAETRYLTTLISELEAARGVLQYVALAGQMDPERPQDVRPQPPPVDEWGFAELVRPHPSPDSPPRARGGVGGGVPDNLDQGEGFDPHERPEQRIPLENIAEAVGKHPHFVLIGDPGAGKTTTIRKLALDAARARLDNPRTAPIPLLLYLPQWDQEPTPADFVRSRWPLGGDPMGMLRRGDVLLYLDGLNEMGANGPRRAKQISEWFADPDNAPAHAIVTCRAGDYAGDDLRLGEMPTVLAQELDETQIRQFATNYLKAQAGAFLARVLPEKNEGHEHEWERQQRKSRSLFRLAHNPYMLSALMFVYEQSGDLPRNTGALFHRLIRALWKREEARGTTGGIPFEEAEAAFARLAFAMIDQGKPLDVPESWALRWLAGLKYWWGKIDTQTEKLLRSGVNANYVVVSGGQMRFYHQLMQETFAAIMLKQTGVAGRIRHPQFVLGKRYIQKWDQVVIALCGIGNADTTIRAILQIDPFLAEQCVATGVENGAVRQTIVSRLVETLGNTNSHVREASVALLRQIGVPAVEPLIAALSDTNRYMRQAAAKTLGKIGDPRTVEPLIVALGDADSEVRGSAAVALGKIGDTRAIGPLIAMLSDFSKIQIWIRVCDVAAVALGEIGDIHAIGALITALSDADERVQRVAAKALEQIGTPEARAASEAWRREQGKQ